MVDGVVVGVVDVDDVVWVTFFFPKTLNEYPTVNQNYFKRVLLEPWPGSL